LHFNTSVCKLSAVFYTNVNELHAAVDAAWPRTNDEPNCIQANTGCGGIVKKSDGGWAGEKVMDGMLCGIGN